MKSSCSIDTRPQWKTCLLFFFWVCGWKDMIGKIFLWLPPPTYWTHSWTQQALLWAVRVTLGIVGNHRLNMKYWVVVRKSTSDSTAKIHLQKILHIILVGKPPEFGVSLPTGSLSRSGSAESFKDSAVSESEREKVGGRGSRRRGGRVRGRECELRSGGWKLGRYRKCSDRVDTDHVPLLNN